MTLPPELDRRFTILERTIRAGRERAFRNGFWTGIAVSIATSLLMRLV